MALPVFLSTLFAGATNAGTQIASFMGTAASRATQITCTAGRAVALTNLMTEDIKQRFSKVSGSGKSKKDDGPTRDL